MVLSGDTCENGVCDSRQEKCVNIAMLVNLAGIAVKLQVLAIQGSTQQVKARPDRPITPQGKSQMYEP